MRKFLCSGCLIFFCGIACVTQPSSANPPANGFLMQEVHLFAGVGKTSLLPPWKTSLAGYGVRMGEPLQGIHDIPQAKSLYLGSKEKGFVIVAADLLLIPQELREAVTQRISHLPIQGVILSASHTHGGPGNYYRNVLGRIAATGGYRQQVFDFIAQQIVRSIEMAVSTAQPARLGMQQGEALGLNQHRRDTQGMTDSQLFVLKIENFQQETLALLVSFAAHPTVVGPQVGLMTCDFPGFLCRELERKSGAVALFCNAAAGEIGPNPPQGKGGIAGAKSLGLALAQEAWSLQQQIQTSPQVRLGFGSQKFRLPGVAANPLLLGFLSLAAPKEVTLQVATINQANLATFPCDLGVKVGKLFKESSAHINVPISYADGYIGYVMDADSYQKDWYESRLSFYGPALGDYLVECHLSLMQQTRDAEQN